MTGNVQPEAEGLTRFEDAMSATAEHSTAKLVTLRSITRHMATAEDLQTVLQSITTALVEQASAAAGTLHLYLTDAECEICRTHGPVGSFESGGKAALHLHASAGLVASPVSVHHLIPMEVPFAYAARERKASLIDDVVTNPLFDEPPRTRQLMRDWGIVAAAGYPLEFRGELLGVIGMLSRRPIEEDEFELLGIFADQAAMAIKSAYLFRDLGRHKDRLQQENAYLQDEIRLDQGFDHIVGESPALRSTLRKVRQVAAVETTVLLTGETGTGKELIARAIHEGGARANRPMIKINCGAIPQGVVESELFGHERGAFTGALQQRIGRFELADKGTLFMDEVGELPLDTQVKLLRVLQEQEFERVGSTRPIKVDVRLIAATNRDLEREVAEGRFRSDLYYRLNVFPIRVPPLRERPTDIPLLVEHFLAHLQRKLAKPLKSVTKESLQRLQRYAWPGNIRELQNVLERACVLATGPVVEVGDTLRATPAAGVAAAPELSMTTLEENERAHIRRALTAAGGKVHGPGGAASMLGINPSTLRSRMQKLGIGT